MPHTRSWERLFQAVTNSSTPWLQQRYNLQPPNGGHRAIQKTIKLCYETWTAYNFFVICVDENAMTCSFLPDKDRHSYNHVYIISLLRRWIVLLYVNTLMVFIYYFKKLNLIYTEYSSITSWCVLNKTISAAVNGSLYKYSLYGSRVRFDCFLTHSVVDIQLLTWFVEYAT